MQHRRRCHLPSRPHRLPRRRHHSFGARQPPHCTRPYVPRGYTRATAAAHRTWYPPSKKCKSFVPFTSNFPLAHTPRRLTNLAPQGHLDKFFFFFLLFPSHLEPVQDNGAHNITAVSSRRAHEGPSCSPTTTSLAASKRICHRTAPSPTNSPTPSCPTWSPPLPRLHRLHLDTAARRRYNQRHLDPVTTPPFAGTPATPLHPPSHASQAHIGPTALQLR